MTEDRVYRTGLARDEALVELERSSAPSSTRTWWPR